MRPYEYYKGIFAGSVYRDEASFLKAFQLCMQYARHMMHKDAQLNLCDQTVLCGLCHGAELLKPLLKDPYITEQSISGLSVKLDFSGLTQQVERVLKMHLPAQNLYRGITTNA